MKKIEIGDRVPNFSLLNQEGKLINIRKFIGKPLVIYFYPKDDTPGCTREACAFRDHHHQFTDLGVTVFGISDDSVSSHKKFKQKYLLPFDLLSDEGNIVRKTFGVTPDLLGLIPGRSTYVIDNQGVVCQIINNQINFKKHVSESIQIIKKL